MKINIKSHLSFQAKNISSSFYIAKNILKISARFAYNVVKSSAKPSNLTELEPVLERFERLKPEVSKKLKRNLSLIVNKTA